MMMALTATVRASESDAPCDFIQKNDSSVYARSAMPTNTMRQRPNGVTSWRSTARGGRSITSVSGGSNEITRPSATDVTMLTQRICGAVIGKINPNTMATAMTDASATLVGSMKRIAFSTLL